MKLVRLSELSEEKRTLVESQYNQLLKSGVFRKPNDFFDLHGLRFPINYLKSVRFFICILPLEYMAEYVDVITKGTIDLQEENIVYSDYEIDVNNISSLNATAIGNLAYACLNTKDEKLRETCEESLMKIIELVVPIALEEASKLTDKTIN